MFVVREKLEAYLPIESRSLRVGQETSAFRSTLNQRLLNPELQMLSRAGVFGM
jgi:hypothetical protein